MNQDNQLMSRRTKLKIKREEVLVQPSHLSKWHSPSINPPLVAVHSPVPAPLTTSIKPDQLVDRPEPGVDEQWATICSCLSLSNGQRCPPTIVGYTGSLKPKAATDIIIELDEELVGLEGIFGLLITLVAIPILDLTIGSKPENRGGYFDLLSGFNQILSSSALLWLSLAIAISIALFNFYGLAVTKTISATVRSAIDTF
ncbi:hypothetical protein BY996DRAFT_6517890 [Phakopsora pachyrhizi]|nr:hypothetical protein BY996DRAFT_6517890 [Phakopsora pachyrhizi]